MRGRAESHQVQDTNLGVYEESWPNQGRNGETTGLDFSFNAALGLPELLSSAKHTNSYDQYSARPLGCCGEEVRYLVMGLIRRKGPETACLSSLTFLVSAGWLKQKRNLFVKGQDTAVMRASHKIPISLPPSTE